MANSTYRRSFAGTGARSRTRTAAAAVAAASALLGLAVGQSAAAGGLPAVAPATVSASQPMTRGPGHPAVRQR